MCRNVSCSIQMFGVFFLQRTWAASILQANFDLGNSTATASERLDVRVEKVGSQASPDKEEGRRD